MPCPRSSGNSATTIGNNRIALKLTAIAASAVPEAAAIGAAVGATAGGISGLLSKEGVDDDDAEYYEGRINEGGYFVGVHADRAGTSIEEAREILYRNGGHSAKRAREATA